MPVIANFLSPAAQGAQGISIIVDGAESSGLGVPASAIKQVRINRNPYSAEFRRPGKGREVKTADGSRKRIHGGRALCARLSLRRAIHLPKKPDMGRRLFDAFLSGPLSSKSVSFFVGERLFNDESAIVNARTLAGPLIENIPSLGRRARLLGRLEYYLNNNHKLDARYDFNNEVERNRGTGGLNLRSQAIGAAERRHRFQISESAILSSSLINNLRFIFERQEERRGAPATGPAIVVNGAFTDCPSQTFWANRETTLRFQDVATYPSGRHTLRFGAEARPSGLKRAKARTSAAPLNSPSRSVCRLKPICVPHQPGQPAVSFSQHEAAGFFQDEMQLRPNFNLTLGLRYDWQSNTGARNNFAPRLAFAYALEIRRQFCVAGPEFL